MKIYTCVVKCGTCQKVLGTRTNVEDPLEATAAATVLVCAGHTKNVNLDFGWTEQPGRIEAAPPPPEERTFRGGMINMPDDPSVMPQAPAVAAVAVETPKLTPDGIALEDLQEAAGEPLAIAPDGEVYVAGKDENGVAVPMRVIGKNPPSPEQLG